jgi:tetratricopeptide (TPR) repeat protein
MTRFSDKSILVFEQWFYHSDIKEVMRLTGELTNPLDIAFAKIWIVFWGITFEDYQLAFSTLFEIEKINEELKDEFINFQLDLLYCVYYVRINGPVFDKEKALEYMKKVEKKFPTIKGADDFEKYFVEGFYYHTRGLIKRKIESNISGAIMELKRSIGSFRKIPKYGEHIASFTEHGLASYYLAIGNFDEAEKLLTNFIELFEDYNNIMMLFAYDLLGEIKYGKCKIDETIKIDSKIIDLAKIIENNFWIAFGLSKKGNFLYNEGEYDEALEYYNESLEYRKKSTPLQYFWGKYEIFMYHYKLYEMTNETSYLIKSKELYKDLKELNNNSEDSTMHHFASYTDALILKKGNMKMKVKAMDILEELSDIYPNNFDISLHLIEVLFDDFSVSEEEDIIEQIDSLMERFTRMPSLSRPSLIAEYTKYQIIVAKYNFLMKRNPTKALELLNITKNYLLKFNLDRLIKLIDSEIEGMEKELTRWDSLDPLTKKQIKTSEMRNYIKKAMVSVKRQEMGD